MKADGFTSQEEFIKEKYLPVVYRLFIYEPTNDDAPARAFYCNTPFMAFREGDMINPVGWNNYSPADRFIISEVEHTITDSNGQIVHTIKIYTVEQTNLC